MENKLEYVNYERAMFDIEDASDEEIKLILIYADCPPIEAINKFNNCHKKLLDLINSNKLNESYKEISRFHRDFVKTNKKDIDFISKSFRRMHIFMRIINDRGDIKKFIYDLDVSDFNNKKIYERLKNRLSLLSFDANDFDIKEQISLLLNLMCLINLNKRKVIFKEVISVINILDSFSLKNKSIFSKINAVHKLRLAENYFSNKEKSEFRINLPSIEHLLVKLDNSFFLYGKESWLKDITEIRNRYSTWSARQKAGKKQVNLVISKKAFDILEEIAERRNSTKSLVVEDFLLNHKEFY